MNVYWVEHTCADGQMKPILIPLLVPLLQSPVGVEWMACICMISSENVCHCATVLLHAQLCTNFVLFACLIVYYARTDESD